MTTTQLYLNTSTSQLESSWQGDVVPFNTEGENLSIEQVRQIQKHLSYAHSRPQLVIIHSIDSASIPAQNALLKLVEEPPMQVQIVLTACSTQPILDTILSRVVVHTDTQHSVSAGSADRTAPPLWANKLATFNYTELIDIAAEYTDRNEAKELLESLARKWYDHSTLAAKVHYLPIVETALTSLAHNHNVSLTLEHCLFTLQEKQKLYG